MDSALNRSVMNIDDFKTLAKNFSDETITSDEPHVSMRCEENGLRFDDIKRILLDPDAKLIRVIEDRPHVYKLYYFLSKRRELKIIVDLLEHKKLNIRTVKVLNNTFLIKTLPRRRF